MSGIFSKKPTKYEQRREFEKEYGVGVLESSMGEIRLLCISKLYPCHDHPFKLYSDERLAELANSIEHFGLQHPVIVRPDPLNNENYEILSGHNRVNACKKLRWNQIPAIVKNVNASEAMNIAICTNLQQREKLLYSEKAKAYDWLKKNPAYVFPSGTDEDVSRTQLYRYERILKLTAALLDLIDNETLPFQIGVELSFLDYNSQKNVYEFFYVQNEARMTMRIAKKLREMAEQRTLTIAEIKEITNITIIKPSPQGLFIPYEKIRSYYGQMPTDEQLCELFLGLLDLYANNPAVQEAFGDAS